MPESGRHVKIEQGLRTLVSSPTDKVLEVVSEDLSPMARLRGPSWNRIGGFLREIGDLDRLLRSIRG